MKGWSWIPVLGLVLFSSIALATVVKPPPDFAEAKKQAQFIGIVEVMEAPEEPTNGFFGDRPPTVTVKVVESWQGAVIGTSHGFLWDTDFRPEAILSYNSWMPLRNPAKERISLPMKGEQYVVFAVAWTERVWRDIYGWPRRPIIQHLPAKHADNTPFKWYGFEEHCLRSRPLEEITTAPNYYGRQGFLYRSTPDDTRTKAALRWTDISEAGVYWVLTAHSAVKMTVTSIDKNPDWPVKYTVQKGDTLSRIAEKYYDEEARAKDVAQANNIKDARTIQPGMVLTLPPVVNSEPQQPTPKLSSGEISISDVPGSLALGGKRSVLFELSASTEADRLFLGEIWKKCAVFGYSDWVNVGPDAECREIVIRYDGKRLSLMSWHPIYEKSGKLVAASHGLTPLNGKTVTEALKDDDPTYVRKREVFDSIVTQCLSRHGK